MLVDRYPPEDVFARVPELADRTDPVLVALDRLLDDDELYQRVRADLARRYRLTPIHGRHSTPADVLLRLLVVRHLYAWSYQETVARVADSLVLRWFCRVSCRRVPAKTTLLRWAATIRPGTLQALLDRAAALAKRAKVTHARKLRIDGTCVQTPIHHPTDSGLLGDGVRVLTRRLRQARPLVQEQLAGVRQAYRSRRSRLRASRRLLQQLHRVRRLPADQAAEQQRDLYSRVLGVTRQTERQAKRVRQVLAATGEPAAPPARPAGPASPASARDRAARRLLAQFDRFLPLVRQGIRRAQQRVPDGQPVASAQEGLSLFEPHTRVVKRGKIGAAVEFGRQVVVDEVVDAVVDAVEGGVLTRFHVLADVESECRQALPAVEHHRAVFGRPPWLVTGDRRLHTKGLEDQAHDLGVTHVVIPRIGRLTAPSGRASGSAPGNGATAGGRGSRGASTACVGMTGWPAAARTARPAWSATWAGRSSPATCAISPRLKPGGSRQLPGWAA